MLRSLSSLAVLAFTGAALTGCAKVPAAEIEQADAAIAAAVAAEAETYASASLASVRDLRAQLDAELNAQAEKFALTRSYTRAQELASQIKGRAEQVAAEAASNKEAVRQEVAAMVEVVKLGLQEARSLLARAPRGKGSAMDLAALQGDLDAAAAAISEGETAFAEGRYMDAKSKLEGAQATILSVKGAVEAAAQARIR